MNNKPSQGEIASYLKWLNDPDGDAHLQMSLPFGGGNGAEASSDRPESQIMLNRSPYSGPEENDHLSQFDAINRIRALACTGMSIRDISIRTGTDERFVKTVIFSPGQINRRYE